MLLVHVLLSGNAEVDGGEEFRHLAEGTGAAVESCWTVQRARLDPATCIGSGKVEEIGSYLREHPVDLVLFDRLLTPVQERNLERAWSIRVVDRVGLILDIFARRAKTHEGQLQVELAQLDHLRTRLVRGWTHLERQRGGIGLRGPGETQLETDRRLIGERIRALRTKLARVVGQRATQRRARQRAPLPMVALVGYTNAGKSSLFNALTQTQQYAANQLFATLDPTVRRVTGVDAELLLADTVGFLRDLPTELIAAFRATLEEVNQAQLLLHVVDISADDRDLQIAAVESVLEAIGAAQIPRLLVWNKIDQVGMAPELLRDAAGQLSSVRLSAQTGAGVDLLRSVLPDLVGSERIRVHYRLRPEEGALRAEFHRLGRVLAERYDVDGVNHLWVELEARSWAQLRARHGLQSCQGSDLAPTMRP